MTNKQLSKETIAVIRDLVMNGQTKAQISRDLNIPYKTIWYNTKDIRHQKAIPKKLKEKIQAEVENGKLKYQIAKDYKISLSTVYNITEDGQNKSYGWSGIRGKTLDLLQEIITKGYAFPKVTYVQKQYRLLRKYFPTIRKVNLYKRNILFLEGKEDVAVRAFLNDTKKKIISYNGLKQVTDSFGANISKKEKEAFLFKKRGGRVVKNRRVQKGDSLREKDDSFSFFYIRRYCY